MKNSDTYASSLARSGALETAIAADPGRFRVLTGDRPTGALHLGHYFGTLQNRVRLQDAGVETCIVIADYQVVTDRDGVGDLSSAVHDLVLDYLATGIDPTRSTIFPHSAIPALNQLIVPFLSLVTDAELRRNPTVKAEAEAMPDRPLGGLLLTYPVHQAADILACGGTLVPVGKDQLPHVEMTRLIARRFNDRYADGHAVFAEPEPLLTDTPLLSGLDGHKMSKSRHNGIELRATADETARLIRRAKTDAIRTITYEPEARPEVANLLRLAALCSDETPEQIAVSIGDKGSGVLKQIVTDAVNGYFAPLRTRRAHIAAHPDHIASTLRDGVARATELAELTLDRVRTAMDMQYLTTTR